MLVASALALALTFVTSRLAWRDELAVLLSLLRPARASS
jgi:hypothetical protein